MINVERVKQAESFADLEPLIKQWQRETFPKMNSTAVWLVKWEEEFKELLECDTLSELFEEAADVIIVSFGVQLYNEELGTFLFNSIIKEVQEMLREHYNMNEDKTLAQLGKTTKKKLLKNIERTWEFHKTDILEIGVYKGSH